MERLVTAANGTVLCVDETGDPAGPTVLFLEGHSAQLIQTPTQWVRRLVAAGCCVLRMDNRDVGRSQRFAIGPSSRYTLEDMADDVHALLAVRSGSPVVAVGHSMGGAIAQFLALDHPDDVAGLLLVSTWAKVEAAVAECQEVAPAPAPFEDEAGFIAYEQVALPRGGGSAYPVVASRVEALARSLWRRGVDWDGIERQSLAMGRTQPWATRLGELGRRCAAGILPVTIVHGDEDVTISSAAARALHEALPGSSMLLVPGMGHQRPTALSGNFADLTLGLLSRTRVSRPIPPRPVDSCADILAATTVTGGGISARETAGLGA